MSAPTSAEATVRVAVDPLTAFRVFTDEIAAWWVPGPINWFDADRATAMELESGLGGRVLERHGDAEPLVIATVTDWMPGQRLGLTGVVDDSQTDITFRADGDGTLVHVHAFLRPGGRQAFLFWPRVLPWYADHLTPHH